MVLRPGARTGRPTGCCLRRCDSSVHARRRGPGHRPPLFLLVEPLPALPACRPFVEQLDRSRSWLRVHDYEVSESRDDVQHYLALADAIGEQATRCPPSSSATACPSATTMPNTAEPSSRKRCSLAAAPSRPARPISTGECVASLQSEASPPCRSAVDRHGRPRLRSQQLRAFVHGRVPDGVHAHPDAARPDRRRLLPVSGRLRSASPSPACWCGLPTPATRTPKWFMTPCSSIAVWRRVSFTRPSSCATRKGRCWSRPNRRDIRCALSACAEWASARCFDAKMWRRRCRPSSRRSPADAAERRPQAFAHPGGCHQAIGPRCRRGMHLGQTLTSRDIQWCQTLLNIGRSPSTAESWQSRRSG